MSNIFNHSVTKRQKQLNKYEDIHEESQYTSNTHYKNNIKQLRNAEYQATKKGIQEKLKKRLSLKFHYS